MKAHDKHQNFRSAAVPQPGIKGFSLVELIIVLTIIVILSAVSLPYLFQHRRLYKAEEQSLKVMDLMQEAGQLALTRRRTMRLEIDITANQVLIIDENVAGTAADDRLVKAIPLLPVNEVRIDKIPNGINIPPDNYSNALFAVDSTGHKVGTATVVGNNVWAARFKSDGSVVNAAGNPISVNLYSWEPLKAGNDNPKDPKQVKAVTLFSGSGAVRYWKYNGTAFQPY